ncbi:class I SAM-dependent methyltransferase [Gracilibacillus marinus]|uniref:Class I SAM-dependent methyltransferase n=1 Tax=Gracilibacillus marinus TaxID=630535 RepID=A0ABV8VXG4_9BACI
MTDQYFSNNPNVSSEKRTWTYELLENKLIFTTDNGVFSKGEVDFGSKVLLETYALPQIAGAILDFGCGYGPVGIALAKCYPDREFIGVDINKRAVDLANENAKQNQVENVRFLESDKLENVQGEKFASVLTNPPIRAGKQTVHAMFEDAYEALLSGGELWVVIQKKQGAPSAEKKLKELFANVETVTKRKGYFIFKAEKV